MSSFFKTLGLCSAGLFLWTNLQAQVRYPKVLFKDVNQKAMTHWVDSVFKTLNTEEQLAQLIMPIVYPSQNTQDIKREEQRFSKFKWGGILYQKGLMAHQLIMNKRLQQTNSIPLLIALDGEWGLYMRLKDAPRFPRNLGLGLAGDAQMLYEYGREIARECRLMGIHVNFAPTVDVNINPLNPVIGSRSFGSTPSVVSQLSEAYALGLEDGGVLSVAKHFPGHGDTSEDSHKTLPIVQATRKRLELVELAPFKHYINSGLGGIMTAHLRVPALENRSIPSSLSPNVCTDLLKKDLGFQGLIFTDGLEMEGVQTQSLGDIGVAALLAGNDILLGPASPEAQLNNLVLAYWDGRLPAKLIEEKVRKVLAYKYRLIISERTSTATAETINKLIWTSSAKNLQQKLWMHSLYTIHKAPEAQALLNSNKIQRIAVLDYGKSGFEVTQTPITGRNGQIINFLDLPSLQQSYKDYDLIVINSYTTQRLPETIMAIANKRPTILNLYTTPFKFKGADWIRSFLLVQLTMEATAEARRATLGKLLGGTIFNDDFSPNSTTATSGELDPTAAMHSH
jgi:glycosyl hydrolase, family 3